MKSPLNYMGGKSRLVKTLVPMIHKLQHTCYCEPFCGAAWVLTLNNHHRIAEVFGRFFISEIPTSYSTGLNAKQRVTELIITNR